MTPAPASASSIKEHILRLSQKLPAAPQIFGRLSLLLHDYNADLGKIVNLISIDAGLTARVLRLSNSVFFRGRLPVQSLDEAIHRVGFQEVHKIVGVAMTEQVFKDGLPAYRLNSQQVWENSITTALAMELLSSGNGQDSHAAYTMGLLRQIGKLVLGRILEKEHPGAFCPDDIDLATWERARLTIASHEAAAYILESWKLPPAVHLGMRHHHHPEKYPHDGALAAQLHLACWIVHELGRGVQAEASIWELTEERLNLAGVSEEFVRGCVDETENEFNDLKERLGGL